MSIPEKDVKPEDRPHAFAPPNGPAWPLAGKCERCQRGSGHHIHELYVPELDDPENRPHAYVKGTLPEVFGAPPPCKVCVRSKENEIHDVPDEPERVYDTEMMDEHATPEPAPSVPWVLEGFEPRAWFSPTDGYFVYWASNAGEMLMIRAWDSRRVTTLPEDAHEIGGYPTQHAYDVVCTALAQHRERADNLEGRAKLLRDKILPVIGGDWTIGPPPLEVAVDTLIHLVRLAEARGEES